MKLHINSLCAVALALWAGFAALPTIAADLPKVDVYKSPSCGCCTLWVEHMKKSGFKVEVHEANNIAPFRQRFGVPDEMASCHTAVVGGYAIEGHVPAADVKRLLKETPMAAGIAVPGMVQGSPGMEQERGREPYQTMLFTKNHRFTAFAAH